jgi:hypothetical protein
MSTSTKQGLFYLAFAYLFFSTTEPFVYANVGIDPSWTESLVMAINQNFVFGKDFIFNYGPLGYLNTGLLPESISPWVLFFFHTFLLANYLFIIKLSFQKMENDWWKAAIVAVIILLPWGFFADVTFTLFYFLIFWLLFVNEYKNTIGLVLAIILAVLIFYIKVNLSLIAYAVLILSLIYFILTKRVYWKQGLMTVCLLLIATYAFSILLNVSIPDYLGASLKIIDAYQDGQAVNILKIKELIFLVVFEICILGVVLYFIWVNKASFSKNLYLYIIAALAWFLCFKQAHTATGYYNVFGFFLFLPVLAILLFLFAKQFRNGHKMVLMVLVLQMFSTQIVRLTMVDYSLKNYSISFFPNKVIEEIKSTRNPLKSLNTLVYKSPLNYFSKHFAYAYNNNFEQKEINELRVFPRKKLDKLKGASVDLMPWEISYIYFNKLKYNPRPIIQTYQANSDWLAFKNEEKYFSKNAPQFVLASIEPYREQNPIWMDKGAYLALAKNYSIVDTINMPYDNLIVFERNMDLININYKPIEKGTHFLQEVINIPEGGRIYFSADVEYSLLGKLARLIFQPPYLRCTVVYDDNEKEMFRIPPPILRGGILASEKVTIEEEFLRFVNEKPNRGIKSLTFWSNESWGFKNDFTYSFDLID